MHGYLATVLRTHDCPTLEIGGCDDHVHALFALSRNHSIAQIVKDLSEHPRLGSRQSSDAIQDFVGRTAMAPSRLVNLMLVKSEITYCIKNNIIAERRSKMSFAHS